MFFIVPTMNLQNLWPLFVLIAWIVFIRIYIFFFSSTGSIFCVHILVHSLSHISFELKINKSRILFNTDGRNVYLYTLAKRQKQNKSTTIYIFCGGGRILRILWESSFFCIIALIFYYQHVCAPKFINIYQTKRKTQNDSRFDPSFTFNLTRKNTISLVN